VCVFQGVVREHQSLAAFFGYTLRHVGIAGNWDICDYICMYICMYVYMYACR
jgi:hypothetical protein